MFPIERNGKIPMYEQIYEGVRKEIAKGHLKPGDRLLSVRRFAETYGISKITVEQAYAQLAAEGYIKAHNRAPYEVLSIFGDEKITSINEDETIEDDSDLFNDDIKISDQIEYNFATGDMDPEGFDYKRWKRLISGVLKEPQSLMSYGEENGECVLREAIARYLYENRGVNTAAKRVVIAAGTQVLMNILVSLIQKQGQEKVKIACKEQNDLNKMFYDEASLEISSWDGTGLAELKDVNVLYCTPSHSDYRGGVLSIGERLSLLEWAKEHNSYIIEDDYDSELRYYGRPISAMQGLDKDGHVIYIGSVSKVLPPSIRISYMVLPDDLYRIYKNEIERYRQTAGKVEQLVLARYIESGEWARQIRRLRKHYQEKSKYMVSLLQNEFGDKVNVTSPEGGVYICLRLDTKEDLAEIMKKAKAEQCAVKFAGEEDGYPTFLLSFSAISTGKLPEAIKALGRAWKGI